MVLSVAPHVHAVRRWVGPPPRWLMNEINDVINVSLVRELVASQFPDWAQLPIERVEPNGWDNRTFRLGSEMSVRLPSHQRYAAQVENWLRFCAKAGSYSLDGGVSCARGKIRRGGFCVAG